MAPAQLGLFRAFCIEYVRDPCVNCALREERRASRRLPEAERCPQPRATPASRGHLGAAWRGPSPLVGAAGRRGRRHPVVSRGAPRRRAGGWAAAWRRRWRCWAGLRASPTERGSCSGAAGRGWGGGAGRAGPRLPSALTVGVARRGCGVGRAAEAGCCRAMSSAERPKRPLSAYFRFLRDNQPAFRQQNPGRAASNWVLGKEESVRELQRQLFLEEN